MAWWSLRARLKIVNTPTPRNDTRVPHSPPHCMVSSTSVLCPPGLKSKAKKKKKKQFHKFEKKKRKLQNYTDTF